MDEKIVDLVIDFETIGFAPDGMVLDFAATPFVSDIENPPTFKELCEASFYRKFCTVEQESYRPIDDSVVDFWLKQSEDARVILDQSPDDVHLFKGMKDFIDWCPQVGVDLYKSQAFCRGSEFDFGILTDIIRQMYNTRDVFNVHPFRFWNLHDIRTAIQENLGRGVTTTPLRHGILDGFIKHNSVHDCVAAAIQLVYARRYAFGLEEPPTLEETDPLTLTRKEK